MRLAWATDLHLDSVDMADVGVFCAEVRKSGATALLVTGDIAESSSLVEWIQYLEDHLEIHICFVLGNHDYYGSNIQSVRNAVHAITGETIKYLTQNGPVQLSEGVCLVGNDGWGDCRIGDLENFEILTDYFAIDDLRATINQRNLRAGDFERVRLRKKLGELGDQAAEELRPHLVEAARTSNSVVILTHVPPFRESCWHGGAVSEETWLPGFTCKALGDLLMSVAERHPETSFDVLCGHTHGSGTAQILPNLLVHTGFGNYGLLCFGSVDLNGDEVLVKGPSL